MRAPRIAVAAAVTAMTAVFAGCAPGGMDAAPPSTSPPAATATPSAAESTPTPATDEPTTTAGAYVDYSDGAIVATPGPMPGPEAVQPLPGLRHSPLSLTTDEPLQLTV